MYYRMEQEVDEESVYFIRRPPASIKPKPPWFAGSRFPSPPQEPITIPLHPKSGPVMPDYLESAIPVFSQRMIDTFREVGVDNLDAYKTVLVDPNTGQEWSDFFAVNVVGSVSCADMDQSVYRDPTGTGMVAVFFKKLVVDESLARGLLVFRLAESLGEVIVHETVVTRVKERSLKGIRFLGVG